jgi:hypothetical protein
MNRRYRAVAERAGHRCEYCGAPEAVFNFPFEVEHIEPPVHGGTDENSNLALACRACNVHKADALSALDPMTQTSVLLFNPRRDAWSNHFTPNLATGQIVGRTAVGRATALRLRMNTAVQLAARKQWIRLKLFPPA